MSVNVCAGRLPYDSPTEGYANVFQDSDVLLCMMTDLYMPH
jgi:hypothetical protein